MSRKAMAHREAESWIEWIPPSRRTILAMKRMLLLLLLAAACQPPAPAARSTETRPRPSAAPTAAATAIPVRPALEEAAAAYRRERTLAALERAVTGLEPGVARKDVERLMGEPDGWDDPSVYYRGDR